MAILLEPATLVGAVAGVLLNQPLRALLPALVRARRHVGADAAAARLRGRRRGEAAELHAKADDDSEAAAADATDRELSPRTSDDGDAEAASPPADDGAADGGGDDARRPLLGLRRRRCHGAGAVAESWRCSRWRGPRAGVAVLRAGPRAPPGCAAGRRACARAREAGGWLLALSAFFPLLLTRAAARQLPPSRPPRPSRTAADRGTTRTWCSLRW